MPILHDAKRMLIRYTEACMPRSHRRRLFRILYSRPMIIVLTLVAAFAVYTAFSAYQKMRTTEQQVMEVREQKQQLVERRHELRRNIEALKTERGKEAQIRKTYSVTKDGEQMVVILDRDRERQSTSSDETDSMTASIWESITGIFD